MAAPSRSRWLTVAAVLFAVLAMSNLLKPLVNLVTFRLWGPVEPGVGYALFALAYAAVAIGVSAGTAWALARRRAELV